VIFEIYTASGRKQFEKSKKYYYFQNRRITIPTITPTTHAIATLPTIGRLIAPDIPPAIAPVAPPITAAFLFILILSFSF